MTEQEAIRRIKEHNSIHFKKENGRCPYITEALNIAISALEKQVPKEPLVSAFPLFMINDIPFVQSYYHCPNCSYRIGEFDEILEINYCPECGQAIKYVEVKK